MTTLEMGVKCDLGCVPVTSLGSTTLVFLTQITF